MVKLSATRRSARRSAIAKNTIFSSIFSALIRTTAHPLAFALFLFTVFFVCSELLTTKGPLEFLDEFLKKEAELSSTNKLEAWVLKLFDKVVKLFITYKIKVAAITAYAISPVLRPNKPNLIVFGVGCTLAIGFASIPFLTHFCFALVFWAYTQVNKTYHRFIIVLVTILVLWVWALNKSESEDGGGVGSGNRTNAIPRG